MTAMLALIMIVALIIDKVQTAHNRHLELFKDEASDE
jgi:hypothetical protein